VKIILRKKDSGTSIILFIFNIFGELTKQYAIPLKGLIEMMLQFDKNETSTRMGLSRMVKAGILANKKSGDEVVYQLTEYGLENIGIWNSGIAGFFERYRKRQQDWMRKWSAVALLDFSKSEKGRQAVTDGLTEMGLREIARNTWICPYQIPEGIAALAEGEGIRYFAINNGDLGLNFRTAELLNDIFQVETIRKEYHGLLALLDEISRESSGLKDGDGRHLELLFRLGWNFYDVAVSDPALPKALLGEWEGDRAVQEFRRLRAHLYEMAAKYLRAISIK